MPHSAVPPPPSANRPLLYYGWWIVLGALVAQFVAIGTQTSVSGAFMVPMTQELGWDRGQFTLASSLSTVVSGLVGLVIGVQVDR